MTVKTLIPVLSLLLFAAAGCGGEPEPTSAPELRGERLDVAERRLDELGLEFERVGGGALGIVVRSNWTVCRQQPAPGTQTSEVRLIVDRSCPPPPAVRRVVPDLAGLLLAAASRRLARLDLPYSAESLDGLSPAPSMSKVCDQAPPAGERTNHVTLYVARDCDPAPAPPPVTPAVPDVRGLPLDAAKADLEARGIGWSLVPSGPGPVVDTLWEVCSQAPAAGAPARGRHVTLYVEDDC